MDVDDSSSETEMDETDDGENDDYVEGEEKKKKQQLQSNHQSNDRLDSDDNEINLEKPTKLFIPYWDAYDTVNQLFLEISK